MTNKSKKKFIFLFTLIFAGAVWAWFYPMNKGRVIITSDLTNFTVTTNKQKFRCNKNPCEIKVSAGFWSLFIKKEGYSPTRQSILIKRNKTIKIKAELIKIVKLELSQTIPNVASNGPKKPIPLTLKINTFVKPSWTADASELAYLDSQDGFIKVWDGVKSIPVVRIKNAKQNSKLVWSNDNQKLALYSESEIFLIKIRNGSKQKIIPKQKIQTFIWNPKGDFAFYNDASGNTYQIKAKTNETINLNIKIPLKVSTWLRPNLLLYAVLNANRNQISVRTYNVDEGNSQELTARYNFKVNQVEYDVENNTAYFLNPDERAWYKMNF